ncbi:MAG: FlgD immunoglobulin-like domain containing protein, partial [Solirubrobacteraceae bacterium]|nr:FlgD immunoglobulin-like domain containing protein [Solirubrobacteraceae bacterium]
MPITSSRLLVRLVRAVLLALVIATAGASAAAAAAPVVSPATADRAFDPEIEGATGFSFSVDQAVNVEATIEESDGTAVRSVLDGQSFPAGTHGFTWDGRDDGGAFVDDGEYVWRVKATNTAAEFGTATGKVGIDTRDVAAITSPSPDDAVSGTIEVVVAPAAGRALRSVSLSTNRCRVYYSCGIGTPQQGTDGTWSVPLDTTQLYDDATTIWVSVEYLDRYGVAHGRTLEAVPVDVTNPLVVSPPADRDFSPDGDGNEDLWRLGVSWSHPPTAVTPLEVRAADGTLVATLPYEYTAPSYGQLAPWDGTDPSGVPAPDGVYSWQTTLTGKGGDVVLLKGKVGIDRGRSITITAPATGGVLGASARLVAKPDAGRQFSSVYLSISPCYSSCGAPAERQPDGSWVAEFAPAYSPYDDRLTVYASGYWTDRFGADHGISSTVSARWDRPVDPFTAGLSGADRAFSPNGDAFEDVLPLSWSMSRPSQPTIVVRNSGGQLVRTLVQTGETNGSVFWDGSDDDGNALPAGRYEITLTATDGAETISKSGAVSIDNRAPSDVASPVEGSTVGDTAGFVAARTNPDVELLRLRVGWVGDCPNGGWYYWYSCDTAFDDVPDAAGALEAAFDTTEIPEASASIQYELAWRDALGGEHSRFATRGVTVAGTSTLTAGGSDASFTPDGDGADEQVSLAFVASRAGALTVEIENATGVVVRTLPPQGITRGPGYASWDGLDDAGEASPAGEYHARFTLRPGSGTSATVTGPVLALDRPVAGTFESPQSGDTLAGNERIGFRPSAELPAPSTVEIFLDGYRFGTIYAPSADGTWRTVIPTSGFDGARTVIASFSYTDRFGAARTSRTSVPVVIDNSGPPFTFVADPAKGLAPFDTKLKVAFGRPAVGWTYRVRFGDGTDPVTGPIADGSESLELPHRYVRSGSYRASLEVVDGTHRAQRSISIAVSRPPNRAPTATLDVTPPQGAAPLDVSAAITAVDPDEDAQVAATLDWGDGTRTTVAATTPETLARSLTHRYTRSGSFLVRLQVSDSRLASIRQQRLTVVLPEPLIAVAGDDLSTIAGREITFDASGSRPAALIDAYTWDFGDGGAGTGARPSHTYAAAGSYTAKVTVRSGTETAQATMTVAVSPAPAPPTGGGAGTVAGLQVRVKTPGGADVNGATVTYIGGAGQRVTANTGADGRATLLPLPDGALSIYAYAPGYLPDSRTATITDGKGTLAMTLTPGDVVETTTESRELTRQEIIDAGIDVSDPDNQFSTKFEIHLNFDPDEPEVVYSGVAGGGGGFFQVSGPGGSGGPGGGGSGASCTQTTCTWGNGTSVTLAGEPGKQYLSWLIIPGRYWQLKQFFEVKTVVQNLAPTPFTLHNGAASITLPAGLSLAPTATPQTSQTLTPDIPGGGSQKATWIVRGDAAGEYKPTIDYSATLEPLGATVSSQSILKDPIVVEGAARLKVVVQAENRTVEGSPYRVRVGIRNEGRSTVNNPGLELLPGGTNFLYEPRLLAGTSIDELAPGATLWADEYTLVPRFDSVDKLNLEKSFIATEAGDRSEPGDIAVFTSPAKVQAAPIADAVPAASGYRRGVRLKFAPTTPDASQDEVVLGYEIFATPDLETPFEDEPIGATFTTEGGMVSAKLDPSATPTTEHWFAVSTRVRRKGLDGVTRVRNVLRHVLLKYAPTDATDPKVVVSNASEFSACKSDPSLRPRTLSLTVSDKFTAITSLTVQVGPFQKQVFTAPAGNAGAWKLDVDVEGKILDGGVTLRAAATDADGVIGPELITPLCNGVAPPAPGTDSPTPTPTPAPGADATPAPGTTSPGATPAPGGG